MNRDDATKLARELRKNATKAENYFWQHVRGRQLMGLKFNRQFPIEFKLYNQSKNYFIADFHCFEKKIIIEIDGLYHEDLSCKSYDQEREEILQNMGYTVVRFTNEEVLINWNKVETKLKEVLLRIS